MCKTKGTITAAVLDGARWQLREIEKGIRPLQGLVGGYIELVPIDDARLTLYCNESGKLEGLPATAAWIDPASGRVLDVLAGSLVALGPADGDGGDTDATQETLAALEEHLLPVVRIRHAS